MNTHGKIEKPRQLNLQDSETYELARRLAEAHGQTLNGAVKSALREKLEREQRELTQQERLERLMLLSRRSAAAMGPRLMSDEEAIGYDDVGLPT